MKPHKKKIEKIPVHISTGGNNFNWSIFVECDKALEGKVKHKLRIAKRAINSTLKMRYDCTVGTRGSGPLFDYLEKNGKVAVVLTISKLGFHNEQEMNKALNKVNDIFDRTVEKKYFQVA